MTLGVLFFGVLILLRHCEDEGRGNLFNVMWNLIFCWMRLLQSYIFRNDVKGFCSLEF